MTTFWDAVPTLISIVILFSVSSDPLQLLIVALVVQISIRVTTIERLVKEQSKRDVKLTSTSANEGGN